MAKNGKWSLQCTDGFSIKELVSHTSFLSSTNSHLLTFFYKRRSLNKIKFTMKIDNFNLLVIWTHFVFFLYETQKEI